LQCFQHTAFYVSGNTCLGDDDNEYSFHGHDYALYDGAARSGGYDHSDDYDGGYSKSDDSHGYGNAISVKVGLLITF